MIRLIDIAVAPIPGAADYITPATAPANYKDPAKIAAYIEERNAERLAEAALDIDLCRVTAVGIYERDGTSSVLLAKTDVEEVAMFEQLWAREFWDVITYNGHSFDLPILMRRAKYLGIAFPKFNTDRYKNDNTDLMLELSDRNKDRYRSLEFYKKRLGMDLGPKPMTGEEESRVFETGRWDDLAASVAHDVEVLRRLAIWWGVTL